MEKYSNGRHRKDVFFSYFKEIDEVVISDDSAEDCVYLTKQDLLDMLKLFEEEQGNK